IAGPARPLGRCRRHYASGPSPLNSLPEGRCPVAGIFINYRSGDDAFAAALVDRVLTEEFGAENVFRDSRALRPGTDFPPELWRRLTGSTVFLALIGHQWVDIRDQSGRRRLEVPEDYVRREIGEALRRNLSVIPVLLDGARLPSAG